MGSESTLAPFREKWREAPRGSDTDGRAFSTDLLTLPDDALLAEWDGMAARRGAGELGWFDPLYRDTFRGRRVLELGSGLGFDCLRFMAQGAHWTCADIVADNLALIRRIAALKGLDGHLTTHLIDDDLSLAALPAGYDAIWVFGSIHHVPFEMARQEARSALSRLKPGGRWMELVYPRERWLREGAPAFEAWGKITDGERTPWAEWHDVEKVRRRLAPATFDVVLDFPFCAQNYRWIDLAFTGFEETAPTAIDLLATASFRLEGGRGKLFSSDWSCTCPPGLFAPAARVDLVPTAKALAVDLEVMVSAGQVGIGLVTAAGAYLPGAEAVLAEGPDWQLVTLRVLDDARPAALCFRNLHAGRRGAFTVRAATLRTV
jgi:SAM-dependent methyltransferase